MRCEYAVNGMKFQHDVTGLKGAFAFRAQIDELFNVGGCGHCGCKELKYEVRTPQGFTYYQITCQSCKYELKFGQTQDDKKLFPKGWEPPYSSGDSDEAPRKRKAKPKPQEEEFAQVGADDSEDWGFE